MKKVAEEEELNVESHESRERPSWFKAKTDSKREMLSNKRRTVIKLPDMIRFLTALNFFLSHLMQSKSL